MHISPNTYISIARRGQEHAGGTFSRYIWAGIGQHICGSQGMWYICDRFQRRWLGRMPVCSRSIWQCCHRGRCLYVVSENATHAFSLSWLCSILKCFSHANIIATFNSWHLHTLKQLLNKRNGMGIDTGIDLEKLVDAGTYICNVLDQPRRSKAGVALAAAAVWAVRDE